MSKSIKIAITLSLAAFIAACAAYEEEVEVMEPEPMAEEMSMDTMQGKM